MGDIRYAGKRSPRNRRTIAVPDYRMRWSTTVQAQIDTFFQRIEADIATKPAQFHAVLLKPYYHAGERANSPIVQRAITETWKTMHTLTRQQIDTITRAYDDLLADSVEVSLTMSTECNAMLMAIGERLREHMEPRYPLLYNDKPNRIFLVHFCLSAAAL